MTIKVSKLLKYEDDEEESDGKMKIEIKEGRFFKYEDCVSVQNLRDVLETAVDNEDYHIVTKLIKKLEEKE